MLCMLGDCSRFKAILLCVLTSDEKEKKVSLGAIDLLSGALRKACLPRPLCCNRNEIGPRGSADPLELPINYPPKGRSGDFHRGVWHRSRSDGS